jgi:hypothetical protein
MTQLLLDQLGPARGEPDLSAALAEAAFVAEVLAAVGDEPRTPAEALGGPDAEKWRESINIEMNAIKAFGVLSELVELPPGKKAVDSKLVFRLKTDELGDVVNHKSRFVARGFTQEPGKDYDETYSPVAMLTTVRLLLGLATVHGWAVHVVDVNNAFLNAPLKEEIYLKQPEGSDDGTGRVYRVKKALYGLKQAPLLWNEELGETMSEHGYAPSQSDPSLFIKVGPEGSAYLPTWVDDLLVVGTSDAEVKAAKAAISSKYAIKDLGEVKTYLGMQITRDREAGWMELSLEKYVRSLQGRFADLLEGSERAGTPMAPDALHKIRKEQDAWSEEEARQVPRDRYLSVVGSLMFAATAARPDLSFTVSTLAQASADPRQIHLTAAVRALRYLVDTAHFVLRFDRAQGEQVEGFTDATWASEADGRSRAAFVFKLAGGAFSWYSKKIPGVALSTTEAEYKALSEGAKEATWLGQLLGEVKQPQGAIQLYCDNEAAIKLSSKKSHLSVKTKHIKIGCHFIKDAVKQGDVKVGFVPTGLQDADMLTKALDGPKHKANRQRLGLVPVAKGKQGWSSLLEGLMG